MASERIIPVITCRNLNRFPKKRRNPTKNRKNVTKLRISPKRAQISRYLRIVFKNKHT